MQLNSHIAHLEDAIVDKGYRGANEVQDVFRSIVNSYGIYRLTIKFDGSPAILFGLDLDGQFFIALKSDAKRFKSVDAINNSTITQNLKDKLTAAFKALCDYTGEYIIQADLMYTAKDLKQEVINGELYNTFQPNNLIYAMPIGVAPEIGIVCHTFYLDGIPYYEPVDIVLGPQVNIINHRIVGVFPENAIYRYTSHLSHIDELIALIGSHMLDRFARIQLELSAACYRASFKAYVNNEIINGQLNNINVDSYIAFVRDRVAERQLQLKTERARNELTHIRIRACRGIPYDEYCNIFTLYKEIISLKNDILSQASFETPHVPYKRINGVLTPTSHEGIVVSYDQTTYKLVNRSEFSHDNFVNAKPWGKSAVITYGRFNPPTAGHKKLIKKAYAIARGSHADLIIYVSDTQDTLRNPLPLYLKVSYIRNMFDQYSPEVVPVSGNILGKLVQLYKSGYGNITLVVGEDRIDSMGTLIKLYNGVKSLHGYYNFDTVNVVNAGKRSGHDVSEDASTISATKAREFARKRDYQNFIKCMPHDFVQKTELYNDLIKYLKGQT